MITYWVWDRVRCVWVRTVSTLTVWRSIPRAVGTLVCRGIPLTLLALPPGAAVPPPPYTPTAGAIPASRGAPSVGPFVPAPGAPFGSLGGIPPNGFPSPAVFPPGEGFVAPLPPTVGVIAPSPFVPPVASLDVPPVSAPETPTPPASPVPPTVTPPEAPAPPTPVAMNPVPEPSGILGTFLASLTVVTLLTLRRAKTVRVRR